MAPEILSTRRMIHVEFPLSRATFRWSKSTFQRAFSFAFLSPSPCRHSRAPSKHWTVESSGHVFEWRWKVWSCPEKRWMVIGLLRSRSTVFFFLFFFVFFKKKKHSDPSRKATKFLEWAKYSSSCVGFAATKGGKMSVHVWWSDAFRRTFKRLWGACVMWTT